MQWLLICATLTCIESAFKNQPLRTPFWCQENAAPARSRDIGAYRDFSQGPHPAHPLWCR
eukprot:2273421-Pyramimonas_sp.AAC.1